MKFMNNLPGLVLLFTSLSLSSSVYALFEGDEVIYKSGNNQFVYDDFDTKKYGENDHPVTLNVNNIDAALKSMTLQQEGFTGNEDEPPELLFSTATTRRLAENIAKGLKDARGDQDIYFIVQSSKRKLLVLQKKFVTSGRAFYRDGKLNIIIGDYETGINDELERILDIGETGTSSTLFGLDKGERGGRVFGFDEDVVRPRGIDYKQVNKKIRKDWFVIDVDVAAESYAAKQRELQERFKGEGEKQLEREAALLAKQRREMRAEMARMRQQIDNIDDGQKAPPTVRSIEERMATLDALKAKDLISQEEYDAKRREILSDI